MGYGEARKGETEFTKHLSQLSDEDMGTVFSAAVAKVDVKGKVERVSTELFNMFDDALRWGKGRSPRYFNKKFTLSLHQKLADGIEVEVGDVFKRTHDNTDKDNALPHEDYLVITSWDRKQQLFSYDIIDSTKATIQLTNSIKTRTRMDFGFSEGQKTKKGQDSTTVHVCRRNRKADNAIGNLSAMRNSAKVTLSLMLGEGAQVERRDDLRHDL